MSMVPTHQWHPLARALADELGPATPEWEHAIAETPRHVFVPAYFEYDGTTYQKITASDPSWLPGVYTDNSLATQITEKSGIQRPTSSSSRPSLMLAMLENLDVANGMRVLELGTGTGYNAALLCTLLGDRSVVSVDIDAELVTAARDRLASLGHHPTLAAVDSTEGYPESAPYDRVIATHSVEQVPYSWVAQTRPGGTILVDVRSLGAPGIGHLARLRVHSNGTATGDFRGDEPGCFMPDRSDLEQPHLLGLGSRDLRDAIKRPSRVDGTALTEPGFAFALWARLPHISIIDALISLPDGSWAAAEEPGEVRVAGPVDLWTIVEDVHARWEAAGRPGVEDYTITVTPHGQRIGMIPH